MRGVVLCCVLIFAAYSVCRAQGSAVSSAVPEVEPSYVTQAPVVDGSLHDAAWQGATKTGGFVNRHSGSPAAQCTDVRVCYDRSTLYLAFECYESKIGDLNAECTSDGGPVWNDDSIEVFISPDSVAGAGNCYQFVVNFVGAKTALRPGGTPLALNWKAAAGKTRDRWIVEIAIPFATLSPLGRNAKCWRANLCRNDLQRFEMTSWSFVPRWYATYSRFGKLVPPANADFMFCSRRGDPVRLQADAAMPTGVGDIQDRMQPRKKPQFVIPEPQHTANRANNKPFQIKTNTRIVVADAATEEDRWAAEEINKAIVKLGGRPLPVVHSFAVGTTPENAANAIVVGETARNRTLRAVCERESIEPPKAKHANTAYTIDVSSERIVVSGASVIGTYYGAQTLKQLLIGCPDGSIVANSTRIRDYASLAFRGVHLLTARDSLSYISKLIENVLAPLKINHIVLQTDKIAWKSQPELTDKSNFMPAEDVPKLLEVARRHHIQVTPLVQSPGHLEWAFRGGANLDFAEDPDTPYCYCMSNPKSYEFIFSIMDEAIELFGHPEYFHAGRDEFDMRGRIPYDSRCWATGKVQLYMQDTIKVYEHLKSRGCKMMMWGDVLTKPGYREAVDQLPRDIIINDWRYSPAETYPTVDFYQCHGFPVIGGTFHNVNNVATFSRYADDKGIMGMLQTTWTGWSTEEVTLQKHPQQVYAYVVSAAWSWNPQKPPVNGLPYRPGAVFRKLWATKPTDRDAGFYPVRLERYCNISLADSSSRIGWLGMGRGHDLAGVPTSVQGSGTPFAVLPAMVDKPAAIMLGGGALPGSFPLSVDGIAVGSKAVSLSFLHGCAYPAERGLVVGKYVIHYEDGATEEIPLTYCNNIHGWKDPAAAASYSYAWQGRAADGTAIGVGDLRWENTRPDVKIRSIDFVSEGTEASPFLLALTLEK